MTRKWCRRMLHEIPLVLEYPPACMHGKSIFSVAVSVSVTVCVAVAVAVAVPVPVPVALLVCRWFYKQWRTGHQVQSDGPLRRN